MDVIRINSLKDNYIWLLRDAKHSSAVVIDPGEADPVLKVLDQNSLKLSAILITHHHGDHTNGIAKLLTQTSVPVYGPKRDLIPFVTHPLEGGALLELKALSMTFQILDIPGHTLEHIAYFGSGMLFCGDTLFTGGCGRVFEGTYEQMFSSLQKLASLPEDTLIYCGHEYTLANLRFALSIEPHNEKLLERYQTVVQLREDQIPTVPSTLHLELQTNPFLRTQAKEVIEAAKRICGHSVYENAQIFRVIREHKDKSLS